MNPNNSLQVDGPKITLDRPLPNRVSIGYRRIWGMIPALTVTNIPSWVSASQSIKRGDDVVKLTASLGALTPNKLSTDKFAFSNINFVACFHRLYGTAWSLSTSLYPRTNSTCHSHR